MGIISGKVFAGLTAGVISISAIAYTGGSYMSSIKANVDAVKEQAALLHDEAYTKGEIAKEFVKVKNDEINRLGVEIDRLEDEVTAANAEIDKGNTALGNKDDHLEQANADMTALNTYSANAVAAVMDLPDLGGIVDTESLVKGNELLISTVESQTTVKKYKIVNKNGVAISGDHNGEAFTVSAGDVIYVTNKDGVDTFTYTLEGTTVVKTKQE